MNSNNVTNLLITNSAISSLDLSLSNVSSVTLSNCSQLESLKLSTQLTNLSIQNAPVLSLVDFTNCSQLNTLTINQTNLIDVNFSYQTLTNVAATNNNLLTSINIPIVHSLTLNGNPILTSLVVPNISTVSITNCGFTSLVLCNTSSVTITGNPNLNIVNICNSNSVNISGNPNLTNIIIDTTENINLNNSTSTGTSTGTVLNINNINNSTLDLTSASIKQLTISNSPNLQRLKFVFGFFNLVSINNPQLNIPEQYLPSIGSLCGI